MKSLMSILVPNTLDLFRLHFYVRQRIQFHLHLHFYMRQ